MSADVASDSGAVVSAAAGDKLLNNNHVAHSAATDGAAARSPQNDSADELPPSESDNGDDLFKGDRLMAPHLQVLSGLCGSPLVPGLNLLNATEYLRNMYAAAAVRNLHECKRAAAPAAPADVMAALPQLAYLSFCGQAACLPPHAALNLQTADDSKTLPASPKDGAQNHNQRNMQSCLSLSHPESDADCRTRSPPTAPKFPCSPALFAHTPKRQFSQQTLAKTADCDAVSDARRLANNQLSLHAARECNAVPTAAAAADVKTFREQFKQLYEASDEPKRREFLDDLFTFMQKRGTPINRIPIMAKSTLDLYELFRLVVSKGGLVEVINKKLWREITKGLNLPSSITSAAFTLRTQYMKFLYPYECERLKLSTPQELQAAIDGNRREGHSGRSGLPSGASASSCASPTGKMGNTCVFQSSISGGNNNDCVSNKSQDDGHAEEPCENFDECSLGDSAADEQADFGEVGSTNPFENANCMQQPVSSLMHAILNSQRAAKLPLPDANENSPALAAQRLAIGGLHLTLPPHKRSRCSGTNDLPDNNKLIKVSVEISGTIYRGVLFKE